MAPEMQLCAAGYSGWLGVGTTGTHAASTSVAALPSVSASVIAEEGTPPLVEVLRFEAGVAGVVLRHPHHRHQACLVGEAAAGGGERAHVQLPVQRRRRGPEQRELALVCRAGRARRRPQGPRFVEVGGIRGARQGRRCGGAELRVRSEREGLDVRAVAVDRVEAAELAGTRSRNIRRQHDRATVVRAQGEDAGGGLAPIAIPFVLAGPSAMAAMKPS